MPKRAHPTTTTTTTRTMRPSKAMRANGGKCSRLQNNSCAAYASRGQVSGRCRVVTDRVTEQQGAGWVPAGTPARSSCKQELADRPRRNRRSEVFRDAIRETAPVKPANLFTPCSFLTMWWS